MDRSGVTCVTVALTTVISCLVLAGAAVAADPGAAALPGGHAKPAVIGRADVGLSSVVRAPRPLETAEALGFLVRDDRVQVAVVTTPDGVDAVRSWLEAHDATDVSSAGVIVQAMVPPWRIATLAGQPEVLRVRRPSYVYVPRPERRSEAKSLLLAQTSEALAPMNALAWHSQGFTGHGMKVGVIDSGFGRYNQLHGTDLPPASMVHYRDFSGFGLHPDSIHGTGCAEIIHDVVPDAELYLAQVNTEVEIANAAGWMASQGVQVISMSLGWLSWGPGDGTGVVSDAIDAFAAGGGLWVNSAGNSRLAHWQGSWTDGNGNGFLNYQGDWEINYVTVDGSNWAWIEADTDVFASLVWNDWGNPTNDLDLYLYRYDGVNDPVLVAAAEEYQDGSPGQRPAEDLSFTTTEEGYYGFAINRFSGSASLDIEMFNRFDLSPLAFNVQDGSVVPPGGTANSLTVAAIDAGTLQLEPYSSRGPANGPGGSLTGGRIKPDISGYAGVSTTVYGPRAQGGFGGTSAACPHVAGAAALAWSGNPQWSRAQVRSYLEQQALDMGPGGTDVDFGIGRLRLGAPPQGGCTAPGTPGGVAASTSSTSSGTPYTVAWNAVSQADSYDLQESTSPSFGGASLFTVGGTSRSFSHTVSSTTTYYYRVRARRNCGATSGWSGTASVTVTGGGGGGGAYAYWVPGAAHAPGAGGSQWRCDVGTLNRSGQPANLVFTLATASQTLSAPASAPLGGSEQGVFQDIVGQFGLDDAGMLKVESDRPIHVTARIFNQSGGGTFGQYMDGFTTADALGAGGVAWLPQLAQNGGFRCNIGFGNTGTSAATVEVILYRANGTTVGSFQVGVPPGQWRQDNEPFRRRFGATDVLGGYARIRVVSGSGVLAYGSVVDSATGDATTIPMKR